MDLQCLFMCLFILLPLFLLSESQLAAQTFNDTDLQAAIADMRSKSYHGFAILLQMLHGTSQINRDVTLLMPSDRELSKSSVSLHHLKDFMLSHSIPVPLSFHDLAHLPTGTVIPSRLHGRLIRITNHGGLDCFVNYAQIVTPNVCVNSLIRCHGVDSAIDYNNYSTNEYSEEHPTGATSSLHPPTAPVSRSFFSGHD